MGYRRWDKVVGGVQKVGQGSGWASKCREVLEIVRKESVYGLGLLKLHKTLT